MNHDIKNEIYLNKRTKVLLFDLPNDISNNYDNKAAVMTMAANVSALGFTFDPELATAMSRLSMDSLSDLYVEIVPILKKMVGAHKTHKMMYPNFPQQVIDMSEAELYWNAMVHYCGFVLEDMGAIESADSTLPQYEKEERPPLFEKTDLKIIKLGDEEDFRSIFTTLLSAKSSISEYDKGNVKTFVRLYGKEILDYVPETIPMKENLALFVSVALEDGIADAEQISKSVKTPTDVLRLIVSLSDGDVSLATKTRFIKLNRPKRKFFLALLENCKTTLEEEMKKYRSQWIRFGEIVHPMEYAHMFPRTAKAFVALRSGKNIETFNSKVENAIAMKDVATVTKLLATRPGEFARKLDFLLRSNNYARQDYILDEFIKVWDKVSTPVMLQLYSHFKNRNAYDFKSAFPKGNMAKVFVYDNPHKDALSDRYCNYVMRIIHAHISERFRNNEKLGKIYLDAGLKNYLVPFSQRSASRALKTIVRGSKIPFDNECDTIRFFVWWHNAKRERVDIDLSAVILGENFEYVNDISYYNLKQFSGHHSGDITSAPKGASEFIDVSCSKVQQAGGRYIVMNIYSFTDQPFYELPECFAGWMGRKSPNSGEIYEPRTVENKFDLTGDTASCVPLIIDVVTREVIWCDMAMTSHGHRFGRNAYGNKGTVSLMAKSMTSLTKTNLFDLFSMHAKHRGRIVYDIEQADVIFTERAPDNLNEEQTVIVPTDVDIIMSEYL